MSKKVSTLLLFFLFGSAGWLRADFVRSISTPEGLSNNSVLSLVQDASGRIWLGTCEGLNVWNGKQMKHWSARSDGDNSLSGNLIERIHFRRDGKVWVETDYGLDLMDEAGNVLRRFGKFRGIYRMLSWEKEEESLVLTQGGKLLLFDGDDFTEIQAPSDLKYENVLDCRTGERGLQLFMRDGIWQVHIEAGKMVRDAVVRTEPMQFAQCSESEAFLIGTDGGLYRYIYEKQRIEYKTDLQEELRRHGQVRSIVRDGEDLLLAYLFNGVTRLEFQEQRFASRRLPVEGGVFALLKDSRQDILWIATDGYGLQMYVKDNYSFVHYDYGHIEGFFSTPVRTLLLDSRDSLWVGMKGDGLMKMEGGVSSFDFPSRIRPVRVYDDELSNPAVFALEESAHGGIWIGTEGKGIDWYSFKDGNIRPLEGDLPEELRYVHAFHEGDARTLWAATVGRGVFRIELEEGPRAVAWEKLDFGALRTDSEFYFALEADRDGTLWLGNRGGGLIHYFPTDDSCQVYTLDDTGSPASNDVWDICQDHNGKIWVGTGAGLYALENGRFVPTAARGLIHQILEDRRGQLWLSTNNGLVRYAPEERYAARYGQSYGLKNLEFSDGASFRDRNGQLYFGGTNGLTIIGQTTQTLSCYEAPLAVLSLTVNNSIVPLNPACREYEVPAGSHPNTLEVLAMDYIDGENYRYEWSLDGQAWMESDCTVSLPPMSPGVHRIGIRYTHPGTCVRSAPTEFVLHIRPTFWQSPWAVFLYAALGVLLTVILITGSSVISSKRYRKRLAEMEKRRQDEVHAAQLKLLRGIAVQVEQPSMMLATPIHQILAYGKADRYVTACAENARHYSDKINHILQLFHELTADNEANKTETVMFSPADCLSELMELYRDVAQKKKVVFGYEMAGNLLWTTSPRILVEVTDMLLTDLFYHLPEGKSIRLRLYRDEEKERLTLDILSETGWPDADTARLLLDNGAALKHINRELEMGKYMQDAMRLVVCNSKVTAVGGNIRILPSTDAEGFSGPAVESGKLLRVTFPKLSLSDTPPESSKSARDYQPAAHLLLKTELPESPLPGPDRKCMFVLAGNPDIINTVTLLFQDSFDIRVLGNGGSLARAMSEKHPDIIVCEWLEKNGEAAEWVPRLKADKATVQIPVIVIAKKQGELPADAWVTLPLDVNALNFAVRQNISRVEDLQTYFSSTVSIYEFSEGRNLHREDKEFLEKLYRVIRNNLQRTDLTTKVIASEMNMSLRNLYSRMEGIINVTPSNIIREYRLNYAAQMLRTTKMTTAEIIWQAGFANRGTFFKNFQEKYGCTPKAYRQAQASRNA